MSEGAINFSDICTACGLCCDGTLFSYAELEPEEVDTAVSAGFALNDYSGKPGFAQPCHHLCGTSCAIYAVRPKVCRDYRCILLKRIADREVTVDDGKKHVGEVRAAMEQLRAEMLPGETIRDSKDRLQKALDNVEGIHAPPRFRLLLGVVELLLDKHFRKDSQKVFGRMSS